MLDGSFYQYFESKEDLLYYILKEHANTIDEKIEEILKKTNGNIFSMFIAMYEYLTEECSCRKDAKFMKNIFKNLKTIDDTFFVKNIEGCKPKRLEEYYDFINKDKYKINDEKDFKAVIQILHCVTSKAVVMSFKYERKQDAKEDYLKQLEFLKYGIEKNN